ncbi:MAG TPA: hypothetical protein VH025_04350 [Solirubrobacteraceae bacterium]|jgi:hypothetical protein|nr:hypothetical protein [Solirubrobacteraceae bacterium]
MADPFGGGESETPTSLRLDLPRSVAQIIGEALDVYQRLPLLFLSLALVVVGPAGLIVLAVTGRGPLASESGHPIRNLILLLLDTVVIGPLISALHIHAVAALGDGRRPRFVRVMALTLPVLPAVVATVIVSSIGIGIGFVLLIIPGLWLGIRWAVAAQAAAMDGEGWMPALSASWALTRGSFGHIFGLLFLVGIVNEGVTAAVRAIPLGSSAGVGAVAAGIATQTITYSVAALTTALLYYDLRARREPGAARQT